MQLAIQQQQQRMLSYVFKNYNDEVTVSTNGPDAQCRSVGQIYPFKKTETVMSSVTYFGST